MTVWTWIEMAHWRSIGGDELMSASVLAIYALLAGETTWTRRRGDGKTVERIVCTEKMTWSQVR
jgi:hypothetical protein